MTGSVGSVPPYSSTAGKCLVAATLAAVAQFAVPEVPVTLVVNVFCLWRLFARARAEALDDGSDFDPLIGSEVMVAFGIFSLVLGLASIIARLVLGLFDAAAIQAGSPQAMLGFVPFIEGLLTAGLAPFLAVLLRVTVAETTDVRDPTGDLTDLARATASLTRTMKAAEAAIETFRSGAAAAGTTTTGLAASMKTEADRWGLALQEGEAHVKSFGAAAKGGRGEIAELASETARLRAATRDTASMLDELSRLIESLERFVAPRGSA